MLDGHREKIGNFKTEPPGLFRGRGDHPKMGMLKRRVMPEDVTITAAGARPFLSDAGLPGPIRGVRAPCVGLVGEGPLPRVLSACSQRLFPHSEFSR